jgi:polysaccharide pyruvyl transferase WcaK-like protein
VTLPPDVDVGGLVDACLVRDSDAATNFDLALADIGYPHLVVPARARRHQLGVCLVGRQYEYGDCDGHQMAAESIDAACAGLDRIFVNTLLDTGRPLPASTEVDLQCAQVLVTTRMHGALLALFHGIPVVAVDQIKGGAKVSRMLASLGCPVFNAWAVGHERLSEVIGQRMLGQAGCDMVVVRQRIIERSRSMLSSCLEFVLEHMSRR